MSTPSMLIGLLPFLMLVVLILFMSGILPIPVGYERGKIKWLTWCGTGMHSHICYWHSTDDGHTEYAGLQTIHPDDMNDCRHRDKEEKIVEANGFTRERERQCIECGKAWNYIEAAGDRR